MRTDAQLKAFAARLLASDGPPNIAKRFVEARPPPLLTLPVPRRVSWVFRSSERVVSAELLALLERGVLVWAVRLEGEPRPWQETGADDFAVGFRHPLTEAIEVRRFSAETIDATAGVTLVFPLVFNPESGEALPWSFFGLSEEATEVAAGLRAPGPRRIP